MDGCHQTYQANRNQTLSGRCRHILTIPVADDTSGGNEGVEGVVDGGLVRRPHLLFLIRALSLHLLP